MRRIYPKPETETEVRLLEAGLLCSSDLTDDGGIPDLVDDEIDWEV